MEASEFADWIAYYRIDPFGNERTDMHAAMIVSMIHNTHVGKGKEKSPSDFMPDFAPVRPAGEQVLSVFKSLDSMQKKSD